MKKIFLILLAMFFVVGELKAQTVSDESDEGSNLPRMVSIRSGKVNARSGPGTRYPIVWVYLQRNEPVEIVNEFEFWRKIKDWQGSESWVHKSMLTSRRFAKVINPGENNIYLRDDFDSKVIAKVEDEVIGEVKKCPTTSKFCLVKFGTIEGWIPRKSLFGLYPDEVVD
ncbi:MAG: SH3 domain-containing protein [Alphaproteobacteria bacterium]|nr:SH3 domain-containing protein [Alphaproteobacteria bacterium]